MNVRKLAAVIAIAATTLLGACSDEVGSREDVVKMFTDEGMDQELAECIADGAIDEFGLDTMNERRDMTAEEEAALEEIVGECMGVGDLGGGGLPGEDEMPDLDEVDCSVIPDEEARQACEDGLSDLEDLEEEMSEE